MNYPVIIAPTKEEALTLCKTIFGAVPSRLRCIAANQENVERKLAGYHDVCFVIKSSRDYSEYFIKEVLPLIDLGNRFAWVVSK